MHAGVLESASRRVHVDGRAPPSTWPRCILLGKSETVGDVLVCEHGLRAEGPEINLALVQGVENSAATCFLTSASAQHGDGDLVLTVRFLHQVIQLRRERIMRAAVNAMRQAHLFGRKFFPRHGLWRHARAMGTPSVRVR